MRADVDHVPEEAWLAQVDRSEEVAQGWVRRGTPAFRRINLALFLAGFGTFSLLYCVQPLLPLLAEEFGVGAGQASLAVSLATGLLAISILCAGALSESWGRKGLMFASLCAASVLNLLAAAAPSWGGLLLLRALEGIALGGVPAIAMAYLAEETEPEGLGLAMGLYVSGTAFGGMAGRVITGLAAEFVSWRFAMASIGALGLALAIGFVVLLPPSRNFRPRRGMNLRSNLTLWSGHLRHPGLPWLFLTGFLTMGGFVTVYNYIGFRLAAPPYGLSQAEVGAIFTVYILGIFTSSAAGYLSDRMGRGLVLAGGVLISLTGLALTLALPLWLIVLGMAGLTAGFFVSHTVASGWVGRMATTAKAHASSLYLLAYYAGSSTMGSLGGWFWTHGGWPAVAGFVGAMHLVALAIAWRLSRLPVQG